MSVKNLYIENVDLSLLEDQYKEIISLLGSSDSIAWGIVEMIGDILSDNRLDG